MIKEKVLKEFASWDHEVQLREFQGYKSLGTFSPFDETDYTLMEMVMKNPNAEIECENGICNVINSLDESKKSDHDKQNVKIFLGILFDGASLPESKQSKLTHLRKVVVGMIDNMKNQDSGDDIYFDIIPDVMNNEKLKGLLEDKDLSLTTKLKVDNHSQLSKLISGEIDDIEKSITVNQLLKYPIYRLMLYLSYKKNINHQYIFGPTFTKLIEQNKKIENMVKSDIKRLKAAIKKFKATLESTKGGLTDEEEKILVSNLNTIENEEVHDYKKAAKDTNEKIITSPPGTKIDINDTPYDTKRAKMLKAMKYNFDQLEAFEKTIGKAILTTVPSMIDEINNRWKHLKSYDKVLAGKLFNLKFSGEGKGERLLQFLFPEVKVNGGGKSFDLTLKSGGIEVKAYKTVHGAPLPIKLGGEGKATRSELFNELQVILQKLGNVFSSENNRNSEILKSMTDSVDKSDREIFDKLIHSITDGLHEHVNHGVMGVKESSRTFKEMFQTGEFTKVAIKAIGPLLDDINTLLSILDNNDYFYLKILTKDAKILKVINPQEIYKGPHYKFEAIETGYTANDEKDVIDDITSILSNSKFSRDPRNYFNNMIEQIETQINTAFKMHPMLLLNETNDYDLGGRSNGIEELDEIAMGIYSEFELVSITRGNGAIIPKK